MVYWLKKIKESAAEVDRVSRDEKVDRASEPSTERPDGRGEKTREDSRIKARDVEGEWPLLKLCEQKYFIKLGRCRRATASILIHAYIYYRSKVFIEI